MAMPIASAGLLTAPPASPRRPGRWRAALLLAAAVAAWHAWLVGRLAPDAPPAGLPPSGLVQLRTLAAPTAAPRQAPAAPAPASPGAVAPPRPAAASPHPPVPAAQLPREADAAPRPVAVTELPAEAVVPASPSTDASADPGADSDADAIAAPAGQPPPVYPTRLPAPARLHYGLRVNGQAGAALLVWQHDGQRYRLALDGQGAGAKPLWMQASDGVLDAHGLAPERFVDRRAGGRTQAANVQREAGLPVGQIRYSGPSVQHPAWPGAQDRLSWLAQLVAILAAAEAQPHALSLFVTDARVHAGLWQLQRQPDEQAATPWGELLQQRWLREPLRPEGLRIEVWLPAAPDGPAGPWPLRLRMAVPRSGHVVELWRSAPP